MRTVGIASVPSRVENLKLVLQAISPQVDDVFVALNGYDSFPEWWDEFDNVYFTICDNSRGDSAKFMKVEFLEEGDYYFSLDDDLKVPPTYADYMCEAVDRHKAIVTFHGKRYDGERPIKHYVKSITKNIRCLGHSDKDEVVHVGGTGCMAFRTDMFKLSLSNFEHSNMADVIVAREAFNQGVPIVALAHSPLKYLAPPKGTTIWDRTKDYTIQTEILNSFLK